MKPFLKQVAEHYFSLGDDLRQKCFIFPNRRSIAFFRKWLSDAVKQSPAKMPVHAPSLYTMNDFFNKLAGTQSVDKVSLLLELYECYKNVNPKAEPLDEFIFWGDIILSDFDDTDKYLADPKRLYTNVADFKEIQDSFSYLTENQKKALEQFLGHFRNGDVMTVRTEASDPNVKEKFLHVWNLLYPLYVKFNESLTSSGIAYEGMVYRKIAESLKSESASDVLDGSFPEIKQYVFVGLNALNECEKVVMRKMRDAGLAEFCWDFCSDMIRDTNNKASVFMSGNLKDFPQAFPLDEGAPGDSYRPDINVITLPSSTGQVKVIPSVLRDIAKQSTGKEPTDEVLAQVQWEDTAIVLPDENLLSTVLNTIPSGIKSVNVTMGCPMSGSGIFGLMNDINSLQLHIRERGGKWSFYHRQVSAILSSNIIKPLLDEAASEVVRKIKNDAKYYIPQEDFPDIWPFNLIFRPIVKCPRAASADNIRSYQDYQLDVLSSIGEAMAKDIENRPNMNVELSFAKRYYMAVNKLRDKNLEILPITYAKLLRQLTAGITVPFEGEPLKGLQIMGPLETRALDFSNIIVLSCNEGIFPRRSVSSSFIPPELRKGFGLPTYENQDAVWAYYFFRLIQRPSCVTLMYDSRTEGVQSGEESRYIKQLKYQFHYERMRTDTIYEAIKMPEEEGIIKKTEADLNRIKSMTYSVSSLQNYLACPAKFYYNSILKLKPESEVAESLDGGMTGTVLHDAMWGIYMTDAPRDLGSVMEALKLKTGEKMHRRIDATYIDQAMKDKKFISSLVRALICREMNSDEVSGRNLVLENVIVNYVMKTLKCDKDLLQQHGVPYFEILGLEQKREWEFKGFKFLGYIDRLDRFKEGIVRVIDYKTGKMDAKDVEINDENAEKMAERLFAPDSKSRPKVAFQLFLYDMYVKDEFKGEQIENVIYNVPKLFTSGIMSSFECEKFNEIVVEKLSKVFEDLSDPDTCFRRTTDTDVCKYCDFRKICGR